MNAAALLCSTGIPPADFASDDEVTLAGIRIHMPGTRIGALIREMWEDDVRHVLAKHGLAAFEGTKHAAAIHEAGHVAVYALHGVNVENACIERANGYGGWIGYSAAADTAFSTSNGIGETAERFLHRARFLMAGVTAECLFDPDFRPGSALDEKVMARVMASKAAHLAGAGADEDGYYACEVLAPVDRMLRRHEDAVREIALHLFDHGAADQDRLTSWCARIRADEAGHGDAP